MAEYRTNHMKQIIGILGACVLLLLNACIENDIPYPRIKAEILSIEADGQLEAPDIDKQNRTVLFTMGEEVDMENIVIRNIEITEDAVISPDLDSLSVIDLSSPQEYILSIYQDYKWIISAEQLVDRYFKVEGQVGAEVIDVKNKVAIAYVEEGTDLSAIRIQSLKLGPASASVIPKVETITDFTEIGGVTIVVMYRNIREVWTLFVAEGELLTHAVDEWETVAWLHGSGRASGNNGFEYRAQGSDTWIRIDNTQTEAEGGVFKYRLSGLKEQSTYISRAYSDEDYSDEVTFTTGVTQQLPNSSFENWHKLDKPWLVYAEGENMFWDSGNQGATTLSTNGSVTTPVTSPVHEGIYSAQLASDYKGAGSLGRFAAGNLFTGEYIDTKGLSGAWLDFGRPFTKHPTKLRGWYKYQPGLINYTDATLTAEFIAEGAVMGNTDKAHIWVALRDADAPIRLDNTVRPGGLYDCRKDPYLIACGELVQHEATVGSGLVSFEIEIKYYATDRVPTYIAVVCSASKYGDFFTGSTDSTLWLDDFELVYD